MVKQTGDTVQRVYYNSLFEADGSDYMVTKYYVAGSLLIASRHESTNTLFAAAAGNGAVRLAKRSLLEPVAVVLVLRRDVQIGLAAVILLGSTLLLVAPGRRRRRVGGIAVRRGHALGAALVIAATLPWPLVLLPAPAEGQGCGTAPIAVHYHLDHLGSTQLLTGPTGTVVEYVRYTPYGEVRGRYDGAGQSLAPDERYRREFTGYETDFDSGLQYAGARFYNPVMGMFLTHDPAGESPNPYTYTDWDPVNRGDPNGACWWDLCIAEILIIGAVLGATAAGIQAAVNGASAGEILKAAAIGSAIGGATAAVGAYVLQPVLAAVISPLVTAASAAASADVIANFILIGAGIGQSAYGLSQGDYVNGSIGLAVAGVGVYLALSQGAQPAQGSNVTSSKQQPGEPSLSELDVRPGDVLATDEGISAKTIGTLDPAGDFGHTQLAVERQEGDLAVLTSDAGGQRVADIGDSALSGRGYTVFRARLEPRIGGEQNGGGIWGWIKANATGGGLGQYLGNWGGNVCSATCNSALVAGGINTGIAPITFVTPNGLVSNPALVRVGQLPYVP